MSVSLAAQRPRPDISPLLIPRQAARVLAMPWTGPFPAMLIPRGHLAILFSTVPAEHSHLVTPAAVDAPLTQSWFYPRQSLKHSARASRVGAAPSGNSPTPAFPRPPARTRADTEQFAHTNRLSIRSWTTTRVVTMHALTQPAACPVCLNPFEEPDASAAVSLTPCGHTLCAACVLSLPTAAPEPESSCLEERTLCPVCRGTVSHFAIDTAFDRHADSSQWKKHQVSNKYDLATCKRAKRARDAATRTCTPQFVVAGSSDAGKASLISCLLATFSLSPEMHFVDNTYAQRVQQNYNMLLQTSGLVCGGYENSCTSSDRYSDERLDAKQPERPTAPECISLIDENDPLQWSADRWSIFFDDLNVPVENVANSNVDGVPVHITSFRLPCSNDSETIRMTLDSLHSLSPDFILMVCALGNRSSFAQMKAWDARLRARANLNGLLLPPRFWISLARGYDLDMTVKQGYLRSIDYTTDLGEALLEIPITERPLTTAILRTDAALYAGKVRHAMRRGLMYAKSYRTIDTPAPTRLSRWTRTGHYIMSSAKALRGRGRRDLNSVPKS